MINIEKKSKQLKLINNQIKHSLKKYETNINIINNNKNKFIQMDIKSLD